MNVAFDLPTPHTFEEFMSYTVGEVSQQQNAKIHVLRPDAVVEEQD